MLSTWGLNVLGEMKALGLIVGPIVQLSVALMVIVGVDCMRFVGASPENLAEEVMALFVHDELEVSLSDWAYAQC